MVDKTEKIHVHILYTLPDAPNQLREQSKIFKDTQPKLPVIQKYLQKWNKECRSTIVSVTFFPVSAEHPDMQSRRMQFRNVLS